VITPLGDPGRAAAIASLGLGLGEVAFDRASRLTSRAVGAPMAMVTVVHGDRQAFVGQHGLAEPWATRRETPLGHSFCRHVVQARRAVAVTDAHHDLRVRDNPAIADLGVGAYLGLPLFGPDEHVVGAFCVVQPGPRRWSVDDLELLADGALGVQRELDLRMAVRDLTTARRERDNLVQVLAHDIRGPVAAVVAGAEMLGRDDLGSEERAMVSRAISRQGERLSGMAGRLLADDEADAHAGAPADDVVRQVVTAHSIAGHGHRLTAEIGAGTDVALSSERIASIVANLLDNALEHTDGEVRLDLRRRDGELVLVVDDDGPGFDAGAVVTGGASGFGLGRAIVAHHVTRLGGQHELRTSPERGTTVTVRLPVEG
jgi:signal transduction histidine kinase